MINKKNKSWKLLLFLVSALVVIVWGGVRWALSEQSESIKVGDDLEIVGDVTFGRDFIDGQSLDKIYDSTTGEIPLGVLPEGFVD